MSKVKSKKKKKIPKIKEKMIDKGALKSLNKYYTFAKVLLTLSPFAGLMYLSMQSARIGLSMPEAIQSNPKLTILFLTSMINPFIAYLLIFIQKKIDQDDVAYAVTNLVMFMVAELLLQNIVYVMLFGFILYKTLKVYNVTLKESFEKKINNKFLMTISGSLVVICLAGICLFANIRINI